MQVTRPLSELGFLGASSLRLYIYIYTQLGEIVDTSCDSEVLIKVLRKTIYVLE